MKKLGELYDILFGDWIGLIWLFTLPVTVYLAYCRGLMYTIAIVLVHTSCAAYRLVRSEQAKRNVVNNKVKYEDLVFDSNDISVDEKAVLESPIDAAVLVTAMFLMLFIAG